MGPEKAAAITYVPPMDQRIAHIREDFCGLYRQMNGIPLREIGGITSPGFLPSGIPRKQVLTDMRSLTLDYRMK